MGTVAHAPWRPIRRGINSNSAPPRHPNDTKLKQVTLKKEPTGEWLATLGVQMDCEPPEPPENLEQCVGIDVRILKYVRDTDGTAVGSLDLSDERERLEREQRKLSRQEHGSNNWEKQQRRVAECHADLRRKRRDFLHKLSNYYLGSTTSWRSKT